MVATVLQAAQASLGAACTRPSGFRPQGLMLGQCRLGSIVASQSMVGARRLSIRASSDMDSKVCHNFHQKSFSNPSLGSAVWVTRVWDGCDAVILSFASCNSWPLMKGMLARQTGHSGINWLGALYSRLCAH